MKQEGIIKKIRGMLANKLGVDECNVVSKADIDNDLGADSIDRIELLVLFESEFKIHMNEKQGENVKTVQDVYDFVLGYIR